MKRVKLFGVEIDVATMADAVNAVDITARNDSKVCQFVVTPNLDHAVMLEHHIGLQDAYKDASLVLADGWPVVLSSRILGKALPERVTGSDLVPAIFEQAQKSAQPLRIYLLGAGPGVAKRAARVIETQWPVVKVVGEYSPPFGFEHDAEEAQRILAQVNEVKPDILVVGLGAPKQELWVHQHYRSISANWALCVGATIDFLAGEKRRAPKWMQASGLEWFFRLSTEPGRLIKRYVYDAFQFPRLLLKEVFKREARTQPEHTVSK